MNKVIFYIDGYNFYYGLKHKNWKQFYWLDIVLFCSKFLRRNQELAGVKYFSAPAVSNDKYKNQNAFFSANKNNPQFTLILGKYIKKKVKCSGCNSKYLVREEKQTDVNIATNMISDVFNNRCDISIIVSADSDLVPPVKLIREIKPNHKVFVYFPPKRFSSELNELADSSVNLEAHRLKFEESVLPDRLKLSNNVMITKPLKWL